MKNFVFAALFALSALTATAPAPTPQGHSTQVDNPTSVLAPFVGEWIAGGEWADGRPFYTRHVFEWGVGKRLLKVRSYAGSPEDETLLFESVYGWHPKHGALRMTSYASFGVVYEGSISKEEDGVFVQPYSGYGPGPSGAYVQEFRFLDADRYVWSSYETTEDERVLLVETTFERTDS